jgi:hypothetical protein
MHFIDKQHARNNFADALVDILIHNLRISENLKQTKPSQTKPNTTKKTKTKVIPIIVPC